MIKAVFALQKYTIWHHYQIQWLNEIYLSQGTFVYESNYVEIYETTFIIDLDNPRGIQIAPKDFYPQTR